MKRIVKIKLDINKFGIQTTVEGVHKGDDNSLRMIITMHDGTQPLDLGINPVAYMQGQKPDGCVISKMCTIDKDGNIIYDIDNQDTSCSGYVNYQVIVANDNDISRSVIASAKFNMAVTENIYIPVYRPLKEQPEDWSNNYKSYYRLNDNKYIPIEDEVCPEFTTGSFYFLVNPDYESKDNYEAFISMMARLENLFGRASDILIELAQKANTTDVNNALNEKADEADVTTALENFGNQIIGLGNIKANKATTLEGYGILNAYTKQEIGDMITELNDSLDVLGSRIIGIQDRLGTKADKATTLEGYGITDGVTESDFLDVAQKLNSDLINLRGRIVDVTQKLDTKNQLIVNAIPQFTKLSLSVTARAMYAKGKYLYHTGTSSYMQAGVKHMYATSKMNMSSEVEPELISKLGGHDKTYPRGMAEGNGYLYVPYRDQKSGEASSFDANTDVGGYLDIIKLSDFTLANTITYSREVYEVEQYVEGVLKKVKKYFGKSHYAATHNNQYLCVTHQMGGWKLYDISTTPENPQLIYEYDNRADIYKDNVDGKGYADFQQPAFFEANGTVYLAISGYDRDLLMIYDLSNPSAPQEIFGFHCGDNQFNLRNIYNSKILHTMAVTINYPYLYCTLAPLPDYYFDSHNKAKSNYYSDSKAIEGIAVVNVSDINNVNVSIISIPQSERANYTTGEPSPCSISSNDKHLVMDNADRGMMVWNLINPEQPEFMGNYNTNTAVCSVHMTDDGRTFAGCAVSGYYPTENNLTMFRGL